MGSLTVTQIAPSSTSALAFFQRVGWFLEGTDHVVVVPHLEEDGHRRAADRAAPSARHSKRKGLPSAGRIWGPAPGENSNSGSVAEFHYYPLGARERRANLRSAGVAAMPVVRHQRTAVPDAPTADGCRERWCCPSCESPQRWTRRRAAGPGAARRPPPARHP